LRYFSRKTTLEVKPFLYLAIVFLVITSCHQPLGSYRSTGAWLLNPDDDRRPLSGHPKRITEYSYRASDTDRPEKQRKRYNTYGFDTDGNLNSEQIVLNDTLLYTWKSRYDSNGYQWTDTDLLSRFSQTGRTRPLGDGRYKTVDIYEDNPPHAEIVSFSVDGREVMRDIFDDTLARGKAAHYRYNYSGFRLMKEEGSGKIADFKKQYYYSRWDTPDSTELYAVKWISWVVEREYFHINGHGDPTRYLKVDGKDTVEFRVYEYRYDPHGNWTRKITTILKGKPKGKYDLDPSVPRVVDREIVY
jgi:hypothetical protein